MGIGLPGIPSLDAPPAHHGGVFGGFGLGVVRGRFPYPEDVPFPVLFDFPVPVGIRDTAVDEQEGLSTRAFALAVQALGGIRRFAGDLWIHAGPWDSRENDAHPLHEESGFDALGGFGVLLCYPAAAQMA